MNLKRLLHCHLHPNLNQRYNNKDFRLRFVLINRIYPYLRLKSCVWRKLLLIKLVIPNLSQIYFVFQKSLKPKEIILDILVYVWIHKGYFVVVERMLNILIILFNIIYVNQKKNLAHINFRVKLKQTKLKIT